MEIFYLLFLAIISVHALSNKEEWIGFKKRHGKFYKNSAEETLRFTIFRDNLLLIQKQNEKFEKGLSSFKYGVTIFADLSAEEFLNKLKISNKFEPEMGKTMLNLTVVNGLPDQVDWRKDGAVTEIKSQGSCGSCGSFSVTGTVEGANFIKTGNLVSLSEQNLEDCVDNGSSSCEAGWIDKALDYIKENGVMEEENYPSKDCDGICKFNASQSIVKIKNFTYISKNSEVDLQTAVALKGPVAVLVEATINFQLYTSGILDDKICSDQLNHAVLVVGYGTKDGKDYWIVKNSWGTDWGMDGYIWMSRNKNNQCGIASSGFYVTV